LNDYKKAEVFYRESLSMCYEAGIVSGWFIGIHLSLGYTVLYQSNEQQAVSYFKEALTLSRELNRKATLAHCLAGFAAVIALRGDAEDAALLYGAVDSQFQVLLAEGNRLNALIEPVDRKELERYQALCLTQLGSTAFETAMEQGREMTLDAAIAFALGQTHE
jgi:non-specific serine/threonine protein kinase